MKILVADDEKVNNALISRLLQKDGHEVIAAFDGKEAVSVFKNAEPDLVLMDVLMPKLTGYEAASQIKKMCKGVFVPIIFVTALTDEEDLAKCIDSGGDDFLSKPINPALLKAKIESMTRISGLHNKLEEQNKELIEHRSSMEKEFEVSKHIFDTIIKGGNLTKAKGIKYKTSPLSYFSGDFMLSAFSPVGGLKIMLGDFTGHGLQSAVGILPVAEIFYDMVAKGDSISEIVTVLNQRLYEITPRWMFCAACLISVNTRKNNICVWNGAMPDALIVDNKGNIIERFSSKHLPLGATPSISDNVVEMLEINDKHRLLVYSDGVTESTNPKREMFGVQRLEESLRVSNSNLVKGITKSLKKFRKKEDQFDDITLMQVDFDKVCSDGYESKVHSVVKDIAPGTWSTSFTFTSNILKQVPNPIPIFMDMLMSIQSPQGHKEHLYTVLAELYTNALEHGVLGLETSLKNKPEGFMQFFERKHYLLETLETGYISIKARHRTNEEGGVFFLKVRDSGKGFNTKKLKLKCDPNSTSKGGRGLALVNHICKGNLSFNSTGNEATVTYQWKYQT